MVIRSSTNDKKRVNILYDINDNISNNKIIYHNNAVNGKPTRGIKQNPG